MTTKIMVPERSRGSEDALITQIEKTCFGKKDISMTWKLFTLGKQVESRRFYLTMWDNFAKNFKWMQKTYE